MPTLTEYYEEVDAKQATLKVFIAGAQVSRVQSASWNFAIGQVPSASIRIKNPPSASYKFFADVYIEAGFNNVVQRVFTGKVMHVNPDEKGCSIECVGKSWPLDFHWHEVIYTFTSVDATVAVTALLNQAGITAFAVNLPAWTIGTVCEQTLTFQTYGEAISKVAEVDGGRWYETPDGTVHVEVCDQIPALNAWRAYFGMQLTGPVEGYPAGLAAPLRPRLRNVKVDQEIRNAKNEAVVRGCTYTQTNADGTEDSIDVEGRAMAPSPWILTPSGAQAYNDILFSNELIDTPAKAAAVAVRLVTTLNRLLTPIGVTVDGDPQVFLRGTVQIEDPGYSRQTGNWFTESYRTSIDEKDFVTSLDLRGGTEAGGHVTVCPFALFTHVGDLEVIGDRLWLVVTFDGRGSVDPDGGPLTYSWTDNQAPPIVTGTDPVVTVRADPATLVTPWEVTLTVTDSDGCSDDITLTIPVEPGSEDLYIPALFAAFDQWFSGSPDGGQTWNDSADPGGTAPVVISVGAKIVTDGATFGVAWFGTSAGAIYKTTDYCATAPTLVMAAVGSPIEHIWPDTNFPPDAWAITRDGRIYRSQDDGDNWNLYDDLRLVFDLPDIRLSRVATPAPDGVWVFGGEGVAPGPLIAFDPTRSHAWAKAVIGGELAEDLGGSGSGSGFSLFAQESPVAAGNYARRVAALAGTVWGLQSNPGAAVQAEILKLQYLGSNMYRIVTTAEGIQSYLCVAPGQLQRSDDEGQTWTNVGPTPAVSGSDAWGVNDVDIGADGTLWLCCCCDMSGKNNAALPAPAIYKSTDGGLTWGSPVYQDTTKDSGYWRRFIDITAHPTDGQVVLVLGDTYIGVANTWTTVNGGSVWTRRTGSLNQSVNGVRRAVMLDTANDRVVAIMGTSLAYSDDYGANWTDIGGTEPFTYQLIRNHAGLVAFHAGGTGSQPWVKRTLDYGANWTTIADETGRVTVDYFRSIAYWDSSDILFIGTEETDASDRVLALADAAQPVVGAISDITSNLDALFDEAVALAGLCYPGWSPAAPADIYVREAASREAGELAIILDSDTHTPAVYYTWDILSADGAEWSRCLACSAKPHGRWIAPDLEFGLFCFAFNDNINYRGDVDPATGVMTATVAPGQLGAGYEAEHGVWIGNLIGGMAGCYIVAALDGAGAVDGFLYKTWDRFETNPVALVRPAAGFPAAPAGARGYMVAFEGQGSGGGPPPHLWKALPIAIVHDVGGATTWDISYPNADLSSWLNVALPANVTHERPRPICLTPMLWFVANVGGFPSPTAKSFGAECNREMARSQDGGAIWDSIAVGDETCLSDRADTGDEINHFSRIARDAGGRLWAARKLGSTTANPVRTEIWYSDTDGGPLGDDWTLSTTLTQASAARHPYALLCHPTNQQVIALVSCSEYGPASGDKGVVVHITDDRGLSWTTNQPTVASGNNFALTGEPPYGQSFRAMMLPEGRLIIMNRETTASWFTIHTSDNYGLTWQLRYTETLVDEDCILLFTQGQWLNNGNHLVGLRTPVTSGVAGMFAVMESFNAGNIWTARVLSEPPDVVYGDWDSVYDSANDALYVQNGDRNAPGTNRVLRLQDATNGGDTWEDMTYDLPFVNMNMHWEGIALIPTF